MSHNIYYKYNSTTDCTISLIMTASPPNISSKPAGGVSIIFNSDSPGSNNNAHTEWYTINVCGRSESALFIIYNNPVRCDLRLNLLLPLSEEHSYPHWTHCFLLLQLNLGGMALNDSIFLLSRNYLLTGHKVYPRLHSKHKINIKQRIFGSSSS